MASFYDRVKVGVSAAPGTGSVTLGAAAAGYRGFDDAGVPDAGVVSYAIEDGAAWEIGHGVYTKSTGTLARTTVLGSSAASKAKIAATASAVVFLTILAADIAALASGSAGTSTAYTAPTIVQFLSGGTGWPKTPTVGNTLITMAVYAGSSAPSVSGWTTLFSTGPDADGNGLIIVGKIATANEGSVPPQIGGNSIQVTYELSGAAALSTIKAVYKNECNNSEAIALAYEGGSVVLGIVGSIGQGYDNYPAPTGDTNIVRDAYNYGGGASSAFFHASYAAAGTTAYTENFPVGIGHDFFYMAVAVHGAS